MILGARTSSQCAFDQLRLAQHRVAYLVVEYPPLESVQPDNSPTYIICVGMFILGLWPLLGLLVIG